MTSTTDRLEKPSATEDKAEQDQDNDNNEDGVEHDNLRRSIHGCPDVPPELHLHGIASCGPLPLPGVCLGSGATGSRENVVESPHCFVVEVDSQRP